MPSLLTYDIIDPVDVTLRRMYTVMELITDIDEQLFDITELTPVESCMWLIERLDAISNQHNPYCVPYCNYVMTWHKAIPITAIIILQNPYPNNIHPPIAAAMSFDEELCLKSPIRKRVPPTVEVFANDMFIHTGMPKEDFINVIKNGWCLINRGILLINEAVFEPTDSVNMQSESNAQVNVVRRLLIESEKHGDRVVDIYGIGEAGHRMANDISSYYKSDRIRLSKHVVASPASVARKFSDLNSPQCHMDKPSFSRSLFKHISNQVAYSYTMAKKSEIDISTQRQADAIRQVLAQLKNIHDIYGDVVSARENMLEKLKAEDTTEFIKSMESMLKMDKQFYNRLGMACSSLTTVNIVGSGGANQVARPGPSKSTVAPSYATLKEHTGGSSTVVTSIKPMPVPVASSRRSSIATSNADINTPSGSTLGSKRATPVPISVAVRRSPVPISGASAAKPISGASAVKPTEKVVKSSTPISIAKTRPVPIKNAVARQSVPSISATTKLPEIEESSEIVGGARKLTDKEISQLSSIAAVLESLEQPVDFEDGMVGVNNDIACRFANDEFTQRLVKCIADDYDTHGPKMDVMDYVWHKDWKYKTIEECAKTLGFTL